jgi:hypothetical protein
MQLHYMAMVESLTLRSMYTPFKKKYSIIWGGFKACMLWCVELCSLSNSLTNVWLTGNEMQGLLLRVNAASASLEPIRLGQVSRCGCVTTFNVPMKC